MRYINAGRTVRTIWTTSGILRLMHRAGASVKIVDTRRDIDVKRPRLLIKIQNETKT